MATLEHLENRPGKWSVQTSTTTTHHNHLRPFFPGPPRWAGARRELLDFMVHGKINRGRHTNHPAGRHSIRTKQCPPPPSPHYFYRLVPFLPPNQQCQSTEGRHPVQLKKMEMAVTDIDGCKRVAWQLCSITGSLTELRFYIPLDTI